MEVQQSGTIAPVELYGKEVRKCVGKKGDSLYGQLYELKTVHIEGTQCAGNQTYVRDLAIGRNTCSI